MVAGVLATAVRLSLSPFRPFTLGLMETLYDINQNEADENISSITRKQILMLL